MNTGFLQKCLAVLKKEEVQLEIIRFMKPIINLILNEIYPYITEGIGEDILPKNVNFDLIDGFEKVTDEDAAIYTRKLAKQEGIFAGNSCGAAVKGVLQLKHNFKKNDVVVVLLHDSGSRYIGKIYNDEWMKKNGFSLD